MSSPHFRVLLLSITAALGGFLFGFDSGVINGTVDALQAAFHSNSMGTGFNVASMLLGCAVGAFFAGTLADRFGRKPILLLTAVLFIIGSWGSGIAHGSVEFIVYRVLGGIAVGAASVVCPAYISEIAPAQIRGTLATLQQLMIVLGLFFSFLSNYLLARAAGTPSGPLWGFHGWQWMFWMEIPPSALFFFALFFIPESPRYLVAAGKLAEAGNVLRGVGHEKDFAAKVAEIEQTLAQDRRPSIRDLIDRKRGRIHPIVWVGVGLAAFQQFVGINVVFYYGAVMWQAAGFSEADALLSNVIIAGINIGSTFVAMYLVDRVGRKPLLVVGSIGMTITLGALAVIFGTSATAANGTLELSKSVGTVTLVLANLYVAFFAVSWGPVMWVMLGEMFPNQFRGAALAVSGFTQWIANFATTMTFPIFLTGIGLGGAYSVYAVGAAISFFFVWKFVVETKGKRLEEMGDN